MAKTKRNDKGPAAPAPSEITPAPKPSLMWKLCRKELKAWKQRVTPGDPAPSHYFNGNQIAWLKADLSPKNVKGRKQGKNTVSYIESWHAINEANRIFGFDAWSSETVLLDVAHAAPFEVTFFDDRTQEKTTRRGYACSYTAKVRVTVGDVIREGTGAGHGRVYTDASGFTDAGGAHEGAIKEAESDAQKRALRLFGNQFGLALYDKDKRHVSNNGPDFGEDENTAPAAKPAAAPHPQQKEAPQSPGAGAPASETRAQGAASKQSAPNREQEKVNKALDDLAKTREAKANMQAPLGKLSAKDAEELAKARNEDRHSVINPKTSLECLISAIVDLMKVGGDERLAEWSAKQKRERTRRFLMPSHVAALTKAYNHVKDALAGVDVGRLDLTAYGIEPAQLGYDDGPPNPEQALAPNDGIDGDPLAGREPGEDDDPLASAA